jgi:hypothetical protein
MMRTLSPRPSPHQGAGRMRAARPGVLPLAPVGERERGGEGFPGGGGVRG